MKGWPVLGFWFVIAAALWLRCGDLAQRPLHNDEAINAFKLRNLWERGEYRYDPHEYHGPALYYLALPVLKAVSPVAGPQPSEAGMRSVAVVIGVGMILLLGATARIWGWEATFFGALLAAVSPVTVYYSRYFIHEMLLVLAGGLGWVGWTRAALSQSPDGRVAADDTAVRSAWAWSLLGGVGLGLMWATKETFVFMLAAGAGAWTAVEWLEGGWTGLRDRVRHLPWVRVGVATLLAAAVGAVLFSSFLTHPGGVLDSVRTYLIWGQRAGGASPHVHPWHFFLERLFWYRWRGGPLWTEALVGALALVGAVVVLRGGAGWTPAGRRAGRFLVFYAILLGGVYSVIRYKTPWCVLGFYQAILALGGLGAAAIWRWVRARSPAWACIWAAVLAVGIAHLSVQAWRGSREWAADFRNPWVYGHTSADVFQLLEQVEEVAASAPDGKSTPLWVVAPDSQYWPLPWYWRGWANAGWWDALPEGGLPPLVVAATKLGLGLEEKTRQGWTQAGMFELRPRFFVELYVETGLWKRFLAARAAAREQPSQP